MVTTKEIWFMFNVTVFKSSSKLKRSGTRYKVYGVWPLIITIGARLYTDRAPYTVHRIPFIYTVHLKP